MSHSSTPTPELCFDSKPFTFVANEVGKEQDGALESTVEQDTSVDSSVRGGSLTVMVADQGDSRPTSNGSSRTINPASDADMSVAEISTLQQEEEEEEEEEEEFWIPKGPPSGPTAYPNKPTKPARPPSATNK